jgi:segregation and condensation protein B
VQTDAGQAQCPPTPEELPAVCEALLWASPSPVSPEQVAQVSRAEPEQVKAALALLEERYRSGSALQVQRVAGGYQITTRPEYAPYIEKLLRPKPQPLSRAALETLAVVAYMQPLTRSDIESVRGVDCDAVLRTLSERKLVREVGRKDTVGRPILYSTTPEFLRLLGLEDLGQLPPLDTWAIYPGEKD